MSLFKNLFSSKKNLSDNELQQIMISLLQEAQSLALKNPRKALNLLSRKGKPVYDLIRIGGSKHNEFKEIVSGIWTLQNQTSVLPPGTIDVVCWDSWTHPTLGKLVSHALTCDADLLYLTPSAKRNPRNAVAELEAVRQFEDPRTVLVIIGEEGMLFRRSFLVEAGKTLSEDIEEIGQEMLDFAKASGKKSGLVIV